MDETQTQSQEQTKTSGSTAFVAGILAVIILGGGAYYFFSHRGSSAQKNVEGVTVKQTVTTQPTATASPSAAVAEKEFTIVGKNYSFTPNQITVKKGDKVKITFQDSEGFHNLIIDGYDEKTQTIQSGNSSVIQFTADKAGTFAFYCGVGKHRELGMQGTLVVE